MCNLRGPTPTSSSANDSYVIVTRYMVTSAHSASTMCMNLTVGPFKVQPMPFFKPATTASMSFSSDLGSRFLEVIGLTICENGDKPTVSLRDPTDIRPFRDIPALTTSVTPATIGPSATSADFSASTSQSPRRASSTLDTNERIAIGVAIPSVITASCLVAFLAWGRSKRSHRKTDSDEHVPNNSDSSQPFLQQKAELEAEERRKIELEARERRYELNTEDTIHEADNQCNGPEISSYSPTHILSSHQQRQELRSEDHSKELEAP